MEDSYSASLDWRKGPRVAPLAWIESYVGVGLEVEAVTIAGLRKQN